MCSQPPKIKDDINYLFQINTQCINLIPKDCKYLGITGGEPTLLGDKLFELLSTINKTLPNTEIQILSNGRLFSDLQFTRALSNSISNNAIFCIPLYSDYYSLHDYIVQSKGAFYETMAGLHNLGRYNIRTEIRIVIHKVTYDRLINISRFIYKNIPFVEHVAFMGLENEGYTPHNIDKLWIDPQLFLDQLENSVSFLNNRGIQVSIYNLQLCLLPEALRKFARQSISDWKNIFINECANCTVKSSCAGFFSSSIELYRPYIKPII
jgi:His-Xaa-Ser system radical SAM maturase HxsC